MAEKSLADAVRKFAADLAEKIDTFVDDASELEVRTYTTPADQVETFIAQGGVEKAALQAYTKIAFDGDTTMCVPAGEGGEINQAVWALHQAAVQQAMENRARMVQAVGEAAASALKALGMAS